MHPKESINHKATYSGQPEIPSEHPTMVALEHDCLHTLVPSSGMGSYASHPCGTHRSTPAMLMEIMIQPKIHAKKPSMANMPGSMMTKTKNIDNASRTSPS